MLNLLNTCYGFFLNHLVSGNTRSDWFLICHSLSKKKKKTENNSSFFFSHFLPLSFLHSLSFTIYYDCVTGYRRVERGEQCAVTLRSALQRGAWLQLPVPVDRGGPGHHSPRLPSCPPPRRQHQNQSLCATIQTIGCGPCITVQTPAVWFMTGREELFLENLKGIKNKIVEETNITSAGNHCACENVSGQVFPVWYRFSVLQAWLRGSGDWIPGTILPILTFMLINTTTMLYLLIQQRVITGKVHFSLVTVPMWHPSPSFIPRNQQEAPPMWVPPGFLPVKR